MKAFFYIMIMLLAACAHHKPGTDVAYTHPQIESGKVSTGMPNVFLDKNILGNLKTGKVKSSRAPASVKDWEKSLENDHKEDSLKELYFKSLYAQYLKWQKLSPELSHVKTCPAFHHHKLIIDETQGKDFKAIAFKTELPKNEQELPYYPVWALGLRKDGVERLAYEWTTVHGQEAQKTLDQAVKSHGKKMLKEIKVLCDEGSSDSYFRLENMVTYFASKKQFAENAESLKSLFKIPVFANMLLLHSFTDDRGVIFHTAETNLLEKVQGWQIETYILELKKHQLFGRHALLR